MPEPASGMIRGCFGGPHAMGTDPEVERAHIDFRDDGPWQVYSATSKDFPFCERTVTHHATPWEPITNPKEPDA